MSGQFYRQPPVRQAIVDSLMFTSPPSLDHLAELLSDASSKAGWAAWEIRPNATSTSREPSEEALVEAEDSIFKAYLALYAMRCGRPS